MSQMLRTLAVGAAAVLLFVTTPAHASLLGDSVTCAASSITCNQPTATVGAGSEFVIFFLINNLLEVDIDESSITVANIFAGDLPFFVGPSLTVGDLDSSLGDITSIDIFFFNVLGAEVTFTADSVTVDASNSFWFSGSRIVIELTFENQQQVPAPATVILLAAGLGLAAWRRRGRIE